MKSNRFAYESAEQIRDECNRLGLEIHFAENTGVLYEPVEIGGRRMGNRLAILPMEGSDATTDGKPGELTFRRWKRFAEGGAKMIWGEAASVVPDGRANPRQLMVVRENADELAELVETARRAHEKKFGSAADLLLGIQLTHAGRHCFDKPQIAFHSPVHDPLTFLD